MKNKTNIQTTHIRQVQNSMQSHNLVFKIWSYQSPTWELIKWRLLKLVFEWTFVCNYVVMFWKFSIYIFEAASHMSLQSVWNLSGSDPRFFLVLIRFLNLSDLFLLSMIGSWFDLDRTLIDHKYQMFQTNYIH